MKNNKQNIAIIVSAIISIAFIALIWGPSGEGSKELSDYIPLAREDVVAFMSDNGLVDEDDLDIYLKDGIMITLNDRGNIDMIMLDAPGYTLYGVEVGDNFDASKDSKKFSEHGYSFLGESDLGEIAYGMPEGKEELGGDRLICLDTDESQAITKIIFTSTGARDLAADVAAENSYTSAGTAAANAEEKQTASENFQIGETVTTDNFEFTVTNAYVLDSLGAGKKVPEGAVYVAVEYEYKNISKQAISSWNLPDVRLSDGNDAVYSQDMDASWYFDGYSDSKIMSDMNPGIKSKDAKIFEVAVEVLNAGGMKAYVKADKEFFVDLPVYYGIEPELLNSMKSDLDSYVGEWWDLNSQRAYMQIEKQNSDELLISVYWSSGASDQSCWTMTGRYNPNSGKIEYQDGKLDYIHYDASGNANADTQYQNGTGTVYISYDGYLYWEDHTENAGADCYFEKDTETYDYLGNAKADGSENEIGDAGYGYILEDSARRYLSEDELIYMSKDELRLARNEIFARHGRMFDSLDLQGYFNSMEWYYGTVPANEFDESVLNEYEKANLVLIKDVEMKK